MMNKFFRSIINRQLLTIMLVMLLIIVAVVWWNVKPNSKIAIAAEQVNEIAKEIRKSYANKPSYWGLNTQTVIANNILTNNWYKGDIIVNIMGKTVLIGQGIDGNIVMPGGKSFDIVYKNLTTSECIALSSYNYRQGEELGFLKITIVGKKASQDFEWGRENYKMPVVRQEAQEFCSSDSAVIWTLE